VKFIIYIFLILLTSRIDILITECVQSINDMLLRSWFSVLQWCTFGNIRYCT